MQYKKQEKIAPLSFARRLRREQTPTEKKLWQILRNRHFEKFKFRRQHVIGPYIADFICLEHKLIIEADGVHHNELSDAARDEFLQQHGFCVLRFTNLEIERNVPAVCEKILDVLKLQPPSSGATRHLLPKGEKESLPLRTRLIQKQAQLAAAHRLRRLEPVKGIDFASNDYLDMAAHPRLRETLARAFDSGMAVGAGAARLLRGNHELIAECEAFFAEWLGAEKTLLTSSGYQANYLLLSSLPQRGDVILYDANIHASARDGIRASAAKSFHFKHNDLDDLARLLQTVTPPQGGVQTLNLKNISGLDPGLRRDDAERAVFIVTESLFSMDGDFAPVEALLKIAQQFGAILIVDEAHATGIYGARGRGVCEGLPRDHLITVHTGGKALGAAGGMIAARADIVDYLINTARPFIFATAPMPVLALALMTAAKILDEEPWRREKLLSLCESFRCERREARGEKNLSRLSPSHSPIVPIILGSDEAAMSAASRLQSLGYDIRAIRPPTVAEGTARLRISLNITHTPELLSELMRAIKVNCLTI